MTNSYFELPAAAGGDKAAADLIGALKHQRLKVQYGDTGSATDVSMQAPLPVTIQPVNTSLVDSFGRLRVSNPATLFDIKHLYDKQPVFYDESITDASGNATSTHSTTNAAVTMHVESGDTIIRQSKMHMPYLPGKSQLAYYTSVLGAGVSNVTRRIGSFTANDGMFFELDDSTLKTVVRKATSDTATTSDNWNYDAMDGTGPSGVTIDTSKAQIFVIDFEWLGVGTVAYGFVVDRQLHYCHFAHHSNSVTSVYASTPNLPVRYEVVSTGGTGNLDHICTSIQSEGGFDPLGLPNTHNNGSTKVDANTIGVTYALLGVRLKSTHLDAAVFVNQIDAVALTNDSFRWSLLMNPTVADSPSFSNKTNSAVQTFVGATANTVSSLGHELSSGYVSDKSRELSAPIDSVLRLGCTVAGASDTLYLTVTPLGSNLDIFGSLNWTELW